MLGKWNFKDADKIKLEKILGLPIKYLLEHEFSLKIKKPVKKKRKPYSQEYCARMSVKMRNYSPYKNLISELDKRYLSYNAFAQLISLSVTSFSRRMRGKVNFTDADKAKLVEIFCKPIEYLLERTADWTDLNFFPA